MRRVDSSAVGKRAQEEPWKAEIRKKLQRKVTFDFVDMPLGRRHRFPAQPD